MGSLGDYAIPKSRGVWATPKRYVGRIGLDTNSRAHPGPSQTCAPFAPTMSVRIFGHFLPFPIILARRALCSAPPCTPDAWTNGPHMVCSLCTLVPMTHTPRGRTEAPTHKDLCQGECGQFCHFGTCGYNFSFPPCHGPWRSLGPKYLWAHIGLPLSPTRNVESRLQAIMEEYPWGYFQFWLIFEYAKTPLFGTPISAPHVVHWRPHIFMPMKSPDLISSLALRYEA